MYTIAATIFWVCTALVLYAYIFYAALVWLLSHAFGRTTSPPVVADEDLPSVAILIAAYNEEQVIAERVRNALKTDYPPGKLQIIIGSDGSADRTVNVLNQFTGAPVQTLAFEQRRGKAMVLNDAIERTHADIVVLSDANTFTDSFAVRNLVRWFADPSFGVVCGRLVLTDSKSGRNVDGIYWKYETFLKKQEGRLGALLGSNGAIYAIRRSLFQPIPRNTMIDDFVIPLLAKLRSGCRIVYDTDAVAVEESAPDVGVEFRRRSRIGAGGWQAIMLLWPLLNPARGWIAFTFLSHKILRWLCPFFMVLAFVANAVLCGRPAYRGLMAAQVAFYVAAIVGRYVPKGAPLGTFLRLAHMFASMNAALLVGFFRWASGPQTGIWRPTRRAV